MKRLLLTFLLFGACLSVMMAQRSIAGTITDEDGEALIGASVLATGTSVGTVTDFDGAFGLSVPEGIESITISYTGYDNMVQSLDDRQSYTITLSEGILLGEVVVTGTGIATDRRRTAIAVEAVQADDLESLPSGSLDQALVGKIPGAYFQQSSGQPGQQMNIVLRGINSLGGTTPMILIDGVQILTDNNSNGSAQNLTSRLADIDFSNVERVEVVQGAAAATIYGAQGANGVIQIFTKRGKSGEKARITIGTQYSRGNALEGEFESSSLHAYQTTASGALANANGEALGKNEFGIWGAPLLLTEKNARTDRPYTEQIFDRFDQVFDSFNSSRVNASVTGGTDKIGYAVTGAYTSQESPIFGRNNRTNIGTNINFELFDGFDVRVGMNIIRADNNTGTITGTDNVTGPLGSVATTFPFVDFSNTVNGNLVPNPTGDNSANPLFEQQFVKRQNDINRINPNINLSYSPIEWLRLDYKLGYDYYRDDYNEVTRNQEAILANSNQAGIDPFQGRIRNFAREGSLLNSISSAFLTFGDDEGILSNTQIAFDYRRQQFTNVQTVGVGLPFFEPVRLSAAGSPEIDEIYTDFATYGFLINQKFEYKGFIGLGLGFRSDYASTFGEGSDAFTFPRADFYTRLSELDFWSNIKGSVPEFKVRAAYGEAGIQPGPLDRFPVLAAGQFGANGFLSSAIDLNNPLLGVQQSTEFEIGFDAVFSLKGSGSTFLPYARASFTYWDRENEDIIRRIGVAPSTGAGTLLTNAITLDGDGIQASLNLTLVETKDFTWNLTTNFSKQTTTVGAIQGGVDVPVDDNFILQEGQDLGTFRGQTVLTSYEELDAQLGETADRGRYQIVPESGYIVDTMNYAPVLSSEVTTIGNGLPDFNMSFINDFTLFGGVSVGAQVDWVSGFDIYNQTRQWTYRDNLGGDVDDPVTINGETGAFLSYYRGLYNTNQANSNFVEDGSFIRLRSLTIGVELTNYVELPGVRNAKLTLSGFNVATITDYSGFDPEAASNVNDPTRIGLDQYAFPNARTFQVALNLGF